MALVIHAEHGGGNNSTFSTHVVSSTGTDTYSAVAASLGSLKGPKHGGANLKVQEMFQDIKENIKDWSDEKEIRSYLDAMLDKKGVRPQRTDLRHGTRGLYPVGSQSGDSEEIRESSGPGERP